MHVCVKVHRLKNKMTTSPPAFFTEQDDGSRKSMYQFGVNFSSENPAKFNDPLRTGYNLFKDTRNAKILTKDYRSLVFPAKIFGQNRFELKPIQAALDYPLKWIIDSNDGTMRQPQAKLLDMAFFKTRYMMESKVHNQDKEDDKNKKRCEEKSLFRHQKFIEYALRPYSPIRSLIINSRTGSGKTRMMQTVMDNFACFPNKKIVLFPNEVLREAFYNEYVRTNSQLYDIDEKISREMVTTPQGRTYEKFDAFNRRYYMGSECTVRDRFDHPLFEDYYPHVVEKHVQGATIVLTFEQFYHMSIGENNKRDNVDRLMGAGILYRNAEINLGGAMVLVDEAHLLLDDGDDSLTGVYAQHVREVLEGQASKLHTIGLFTATPFDDLSDIVKYKKLLNINGNLLSPDDIAKNHMMYYVNKGSKHMFNKEHITYIKVPESNLIANRTKGLKFDDGPARLTKHCWYTQSDFQIDDWDAYNNDYEVPDELKGMTIKDQYDFILGIDDYRTATNMGVLKTLFPKMAFAFEKVLKQYDTRKHLIDLWEECQLQWKQLAPYTQRWASARNRLAVRAGEMHLKDAEKKIKNMFPDSKYTSSSEDRGDQDQVKDWTDLMDNELDAAYDERIVIMTDFDYGIIEFSKLLISHKIIHVILQIEKSVSIMTGGHSQLQGCADDFNGGDRSEYGTFMDNKLVKFVNDNRKTVPVILFNSFVPEGISLFHTRHLHVLTMDTDYTNISQMIGRINRLCHTTHNDKEIYLYYYENTKEKDQYEKEYATRQRWPSLNPR